MSMKSFFHLLSSISSNPLFSSIVSLYTLILLYFPHLFLWIVFSPVLNATGILLLTLLRLGAIQRLGNEVDDKSWQSQTGHEAIGNKGSEESKENKESDSGEPEITDFLEEDDRWVATQSELDAKTERGFDPNPCFDDSFVEWDVRAPLQVIYEEYEGDEAEADPNPEEKDADQNEVELTRNMGIERYPSLSLYYPESDSDDSSYSEFDDYPTIGEWFSPENRCVKWNEEDGESLIEIALDGNKRGISFHVEEDNLIEIDISRKRT